jgi:hypothetical protein
MKKPVGAAMLSKEENSHTDFPRTYVATKGWKTFILILGTFLLVMGLLVSYYHPTGTQNTRGLILDLVTGPLMIFCGIYCCLLPVKSKVILDADTIEVQGPFLKRRLRYDEISGRKMSVHQDTIILVPKDANKKKLKIPLVMKFDSTFETWAMGLHDFDREKQKKAMTGIMSDASLGHTTTERRFSLSKARRLAKLSDAASAGLFVVFFLAHRTDILYPELIVLIALMPFVSFAIGHKYHGIFKTTQFDSGSLFIIPGLLLSMGALGDFEVLKWTQVLPLAAVFSLPIILIEIQRGLVKNIATFIIFFLLSAGPYGYGGAVLADALLDKSPAQIFKTTVVKKYRGSKGSRGIDIAPWGPKSEGVRGIYSIHPGLYNSVQVGSEICVYLKPGALDIAWYTINRCQR